MRGPPLPTGHRRRLQGLPASTNAQNTVMRPFSQPYHHHYVSDASHSQQDSSTSTPSDALSLFSRESQVTAVSSSFILTESSSRPSPTQPYNPDWTPPNYVPLRHRPGFNPHTGPHHGYLPPRPSPRTTVDQLSPFFQPQNPYAPVPQTRLPPNNTTYNSAVPNNNNINNNLEVQAIETSKFKICCCINL